LPMLNRIAEENLGKYHSDSQRCFAMQSICADATAFPFPEEPLLLYMFNPLPESGLRRAMANLEESLRAHPRQVFVLYHNPLLEEVLARCGFLRKVSGTHQYSMYAVTENRPRSA